MAKIAKDERAAGGASIPGIDNIGQLSQYRPPIAVLVRNGGMGAYPTSVADLNTEELESGDFPDLDPDDTDNYAGDDTDIADLSEPEFDLDSL